MAEDPALSLLWLGSLLWRGSDPVSGSFVCHGAAKKKKKKKEFFLEQIDFYISLSNWEVRDTGAASEVDSPHRSGSCHDTGSPGCTLESQGFKKYLWWAPNLGASEFMGMVPSLDVGIL